MFLENYPEISAFEDLGKLKSRTTLWLGMWCRDVLSYHFFAFE